MEEYFVEEKSMFEKVLDFLVFLSVFVVTIFLLLEVFGYSGGSTNLEDIYFYVNIVVFIIFAVDLVRLKMKSSGWKDFFVHNWLDVLATIPFGLIAYGLSGIKPDSVAFEVLKLTRLSKLSTLGKLQKASRISKISKEFKAASHLKHESEEFKRKHRL